jgi:hypothetical protein
MSVLLDTINKHPGLRGLVQQVCSNGTLSEAQKMERIKVLVVTAEKKEASGQAQPPVAAPAPAAAASEVVASTAPAQAAAPVAASAAIAPAAAPAAEPAPTPGTKAAGAPSPDLIGATRVWMLKVTMYSPVKVGSHISVHWNLRDADGDMVVSYMVADMTEPCRPGNEFYCRCVGAPAWGQMRERWPWPIRGVVRLNEDSTKAPKVRSVSLVGDQAVANDAFIRDYNKWRFGGEDEFLPMLGNHFKINPYCFQSAYIHGPDGKHRGLSTHQVNMPSFPHGPGIFYEGFNRAGDWKGNRAITALEVALVRTDAMKSQAWFSHPLVVAHQGGWEIDSLADAMRSECGMEPARARQILKSGSKEFLKRVSDTVEADRQLRSWTHWGNLYNLLLEEEQRQLDAAKAAAGVGSIKDPVKSAAPAAQPAPPPMGVPTVLGKRVATDDPCELLPTVDEDSDDDNPAVQFTGETTLQERNEVGFDPTRNKNLVILE